MKTKTTQPSAGASTRRPVERYRIELSGALDRHETEALQLEIRVLAKRHGLTIRDVSVRRRTRATGTTERRLVQEFPSIGAIQSTYPSCLNDRRIKVAKVYAHPLPAPRDWLPVRYAATRCASIQRQARVTPNIAVDGSLASGDLNLAWFIVAP